MIFLISAQKHRLWILIRTACFAILSSHFYVFLPILYAKIIMLHKARYVKKMGLERGGGADQKKKKKKKIILYISLLCI